MTDIHHHHVLAPFLVLVLILSAFWIGILVIAKMIKKEKDFIAWSKKNFKAFRVWAWKHYSQFIVGLAAGIILTAAYLYPFLA